MTANTCHPAGILQKTHATVDYLLSDAMLTFAANIFARDCSLNPRDGPRAIERNPLVSDKGVRALHMVECGCMVLKVFFSSMFGVSLLVGCCMPGCSCRRAAVWQGSASGGICQV